MPTHVLASKLSRMLTFLCVKYKNTKYLYLPIGHVTLHSSYRTALHLQPIYIRITLFLYKTYINSVRQLIPAANEANQARFTAILLQNKR